MKRILTATAMFAAMFWGAASPSFAQTTKITCHLRASNSEWLPRVVELTLTGEKIVVTDEIITGFNFLRPIRAEIDVDNTRRRTYTWLLRDVSGYGYGNLTRSHWDVSYRLTIQKNGHDVLLTASPHGRYRGGDQTVGTCDGV